MKFTWDPQKNTSNIRKHGIDFADVVAMFDYPMLVNLDGQADYGEDRWIGIGLLKNTVAAVVFTERDAETIRIISARKATGYEREKYESEITN